MWKYEKKLEYPINIKNKNLRMAKVISTLLGGPDGELASGLRYLNQRYTMPTDYAKALLTDIATEEFAHAEMIQTMLTQLVKGYTIDELIESGYDVNYAEAKNGIKLINALGVPFNDYALANKGSDYKANLTEDMASEQKARATYESIMDLTNDPDILGPLSFLREREVVHYMRFKECLEKLEKEFKKGE